MFLNGTERLILAILAAFRLTWTVINDDGPFDIFTRIRTAVGVYDLQENGKPPSGLPSFLSCAYCVSRFLALLVVPFLLWPTFLGDVLILWYGLAGALALLIRWRQWS